MMFSPKKKTTLKFSNKYVCIILMEMGVYLVVASEVNLLSLIPLPGSTPRVVDPCQRVTEVCQRGVYESGDKHKSCDTIRIMLATILQ